MVELNYSKFVVSISLFKSLSFISSFIICKKLSRPANLIGSESEIFVPVLFEYIVLFSQIGAYCIVSFVEQNGT